MKTQPTRWRAKTVNGEFLIRRRRKQDEKLPTPHFVTALKRSSQLRSNQS